MIPVPPILSKQKIPAGSDILKKQEDKDTKKACLLTKQ